MLLWNQTGQFYHTFREKSSNTVLFSEYKQEHNKLTFQTFVIFSSFILKFIFIGLADQE